ncbi:MAG TPA: hypothetical protein VE870_00875 [Bacteroidales bacterium]|nr:hypothetical protein [Bacteroidales bacterium]
MKRLLLLPVLLMFGLAVMASGPVEKINKKEISQMTKTEHQQRVKILEKRVKEIKEMPQTTMSPLDKKDLSSELKYIKKEMKWHQEAAGIYISGSALLIIILLIILL